MKPEKKEEFKLNLAELFKHLQEELKLRSVPKLFLVEDQKNADKILGKTGYYDPSKREIHLFITDRHPKDILRSFSHECVHHWDHERGKLDNSNNTGHDPMYAQNNKELREAEKRAYMLGNLCFRDWEDYKKEKDRKSGKKGV